MGQYVLTPKVDETQEFIEIAFDFSNPLDVVREAISNAYDAKATLIKIYFTTISVYGNDVLKILIEDNGVGMDEAGLQSFFDLGNSLRRHDKDTIGEKGHGTKVYFNSESIEIMTIKDSKEYHAFMENPNKKLHDRIIPTVDVAVQDSEADAGTKITILGYNNNQREKFTHENLKDYILWFTKIGSVEKEFGITKNVDLVVKLKGLDVDFPEDIPFGHKFPNESKNIETLFEQYLVEAPSFYCKKIIRTGNLSSAPEISYQVIFCIEGNKIKQSYNPMLRRRGYNAPNGSYTVQERYGLWICKDYMPVQRKNDWITQKGSEYTKFHAFVNCQALRLTANRGSIENTSTKILQDLQTCIVKIFDEIISGNDWKDIEWLENEVDAHQTIQKEKKDFAWRIDRVNKSMIARYTQQVLIEPKRESGVLAMFLQLSLLNPEMFPFTIIDYDTHSGIDVIVKQKDKIPIKNSQLYYVEFKYMLQKNFNHSFENLYCIVCWDIDTNNIKHNMEVIDIADKKRVLQIVPPENDNDYTRYFLDSYRDGRKIEIIVLKYFLNQKFGIIFRPRNMDECE